MAVALEFKSSRKTGWSLGKRLRGDVVSFSGTATPGLDRLRIDLVVSIGEVWIRSRNYFLGCTHAEVFLWIPEAEILDFAKSNPVDITYTTTETTKNSLTKEVKPSISAEGGGAKIGVELGSCSKTSGAESTSGATFTLPEDALPAIPKDGVMHWPIPLPKASNPFRNWIRCVHSLSSTWSRPDATEGEVRARYRVDFFDRDRGRMDAIKSFMMKAITWRDERKTMKEALANDVLMRFWFR